ncbi:hypothetical protein [Coxiella endosymbiont of Ornithodoros amblus]
MICLLFNDQKNLRNQNTKMNEIRIG